jgi:uncharacterized protein
MSKTRAFMKFVFVFVYLLFATHTYSASFDCKKASTNHEKLICNTPELNEADTQLGLAYGLAIKSFKLPDLIKDDQKIWLNDYRKCGASLKCQDLIQKRIIELRKFQSAAVYTDYKDSKFSSQEGTILIFDDSKSKVARFIGNWMPDMNMDPNKIKGYPLDGKWCDVEVELLKKGNGFVLKDGSDDMSLIIDTSKVTIKGSLMCSSMLGWVNAC